MITSNLERSFHGLNIAQHNYKIFLDESGGNIGKLKHTPNDKKVVILIEPFLPTLGFLLYLY